MTLMSSLFRKISYSLGPCVKPFAIQLPDFSQESVRNLVKLSNLDWTEHQVWSVEDLELFQQLGIVVSVKLRERPDIVIDEIIEDDPAEPRIPKFKGNPKLKRVKTAELLKPASAKNNNSRKRKRKSVDVSPRNIDRTQTCDVYSSSVTVKNCKVMLKKEKFANLDPSCSVLLSTIEKFIESVKTDVTKQTQARSELMRKNVPRDPVMLVENPLYDNPMENHETEKDDQVIEEILSIIKTNNLKNSENCIKSTNILRKEEIQMDYEEEEEEEADCPDEEERDQIRRTLILDQDFSDEEGSDEEDYLDSTALHNTRDIILKELGLSDDDSF